MIAFLRDYVSTVVLLSILINALSESSSQEPAEPPAPNAPPTNETREHHDLMKFVNMPASALPKGVRLVERIRTAPIIPFTRNPDIFVDPENVSLVGLMIGIRDKSDLQPIRLAVLALYQENNDANEIGVFGLCFAQEDVAKKQFERLVNDKVNDKDTKDRKDYSFILKGKLLLCVWKDDDVTQPAFDAIRDYFQKAELRLR